jgi:uncharacterized membrane protein YqjE
MEPQEQSPPGLVGSVRRVFDALLSTLKNRVELFGVELQEEKTRLIATLLWAAATIFFGLLAIIFITASVIFLCPEKARPYVLAGFTLVYVLLFFYAAICLRKELKGRSRPFSDSVSELKKDIAWIRSQD